MCVASFDSLPRHTCVRNAEKIFEYCITMAYYGTSFGKKTCTYGSAIAYMPLYTTNTLCYPVHVLNRYRDRTRMYMPLHRTPFPRSICFLRKPDAAEMVKQKAKPHRDYKKVSSEHHHKSVYTPLRIVLLIRLLPSKRTLEDFENICIQVNEDRQKAQNYQHCPNNVKQTGKK